MEHVARGQVWLSVGAKLHLAARQEAIAAKDLLVFGTPDDELVIGMFTRIELVEVERKARTTTCCAEGYLAQAAYLAHHVGCLLPGHDVDFVASLIGGPQTAFGRQFGLEEFAGYGRDDWFHHWML